MGSVAGDDPAADHGGTHTEQSCGEDRFGWELVDREMGDRPSETLGDRVGGAGRHALQ
jgi:hypothetical protein